MTLRFHEIAEGGHRIQNPFTEAKIRMLGEICRLHDGLRVLDLACGKGELLAQWSLAFGISGVGVDPNQVFIDAAKERAYQMDVGHKLTFIVDDASEYPQPHHQFDVVCCIGATWIGGGLIGTLNLMRTALKPDHGLLLVGESYWRENPPDAVMTALDIAPDMFGTLEGTLNRFESAGFELVEMVLADADSWDRYEARQWMAVSEFLRENPDDRDADALRRWMAQNRRAYLTYGRQYMGWGVFVLREGGQKFHPQLLQTVRQPDYPVGVEITNGMLWVRLEDGRVIGNPVEWYPWLEIATSEQLEQVELSVLGVEWPALKQRIEISALLRGKR